MKNSINIRKQQESSRAQMQNQLNVIDFFTMHRYTLMPIKSFSQQ